MFGRLVGWLSGWVGGCFDIELLGCLHICQYVWSGVWWITRRLCFNRSVLVSSELSAFIGESDALQYIIDEDPDCGLKIDGKQVDLSGLAFALRKNSEWEEELSQVIYTLNSRDEIAKAFEKWTIRSCKKGENTVHPYRFGLDEFGGFLFNTALFCAGCFVILGLEILLYHRIVRKRQKFSIQASESVSNLVSSVSTQAISAHDNNQLTKKQSNGHVTGNEKNGAFSNHVDSTDTT